MATLTNLKMPAVLVPARTAALTAIIYKIDPAKLSAYPAASDIVELFDIRPHVRIVGGLIRTTNVGAATSTITLQAKQGGTTTSLTSALAATATGSTDITKLAPDYSDVTTLQLLVGTAALNATGDIEVVVLTDQP